MKRTITLLLALLACTGLWADDISFSALSSSVSLQEGRRSVTLTGEAEVTVDSLTISADSITIEGDDYDRITCSGSVTAADSQRGLSIRTGSVFYDRTAERLLISTWCEISDSGNELVASAGALTFDMANEVLELEMDVNLVKNTSSGILSATAQSVVFDRDADTLVLSGGAQVNWNSDDYSASVITIDLDSERISLSGRIGGTVHG